MSHPIVQAAQAHLDAGDRAKAVDVIYDGLDDMLLAKRFEEAAMAVAAIIAWNPPMAILLSALTVTMPWREALGPVREALADALHTRATAEYGEWKAEMVLRGLL